MQKAQPHSLDTEESNRPVIPNDLTVTNIFAPVDDRRREIPAVEFRNVSFAYNDGDRPVLQNVSFKLMKGELLIVLGGSGTGKSTVLRLAIGLNKPDEGQILIDGEDITNFDEESLNKVRLGIGMDFQGGALFDSLSVYDNVAYSPHDRGVPDEVIEEQIYRVLRFLNIEDAIDMLPAELSGGMRIRVGLARSLINQPHIVLLDEPTAGLDPPTATSVCELSIWLRDLLDVATIVVTHSLESIRYIASTYAVITPDRRALLQEEGDRLCLVNTRIMMLREGRVIFYGTDEQLFKSEDPYVRRFLLL